MAKSTGEPLVAILMGSKSDWDVMKSASDTLQELSIPHDVRVLSAHRTHHQLAEYIEQCIKGGVEVFIAGAGGAAHLAGVIAALTTKPVLGCPMTSALNGLDSLLSTVQMPGGIPVATFAIGKAGCVNAALFAAAILGISESKYSDAVSNYRQSKAKKILAESDPRG